MSNQPSSVMRRAILKIEELQAQLDAIGEADREPMALVGYGCRLPGGLNDPEALWRLLSEGRDAIGDLPPGRWDVDAFFDPEPGVPGKMYTRRGGFVRDVDMFDAAFFGISPREATHLDPQQRLLLEVAWEALEQAGIAPLALRGSTTGVYIGQATHDYAQMQVAAGDPRGFDTYFATGTAASVASGRLAYTLGLHGPALTIDTACSSSLVALHLACQALRRRECDLALVGGVNLILSPEAVIAMCQTRMMAPDGVCKTFDAAADGFGQAEGCAVVVVKRLSDAVRDKDTVLALVRGSAINQDGASSGLTAPHGPAQVAVIRAALRDAKISPHACGYVEAHGTGTALGDPIEVQALASVFGAGRPSDQPLLIGSVKTNLGHLEAAAGLAGLLKVVLSLQRRLIPAHLHLRNLNPMIAWDEIPVRAVDRLIPFPQIDGRRIAGLSSFGFSGTNVHVVIEEAPEPSLAAPVPIQARPLELVTLSARNGSALIDLAGKVQARLEQDPALRLADVAFSANTGRSPQAHRLALVAENLAEVRDQLARVANGNPDPGVLRGDLQAADPPRIAFLFTGQGAQYPGMARRLYDEQPVFRAAFDDCDARFAAHLGGFIADLLYRSGDVGALDRTEWTQPALFAVQWAMAQLWRSWGVEPGLVIGHSIGEYVAACLAGVFSLDDAVRLVAARATLMGQLPTGGGMAAVMADEPEVMEVLAGSPGVGVAAVNGPSSVVISGPEANLEEARRRLDALGIASVRLKMSHAFHSSMLDPMLDAFEAVAGDVAMTQPSITLVSNLTGKPAKAGDVTSGRYWREQTRSAVRFADSLRSAYALGYRLFVELGPKPILTNLAVRTLSDDCLCLSTLSEDDDPWRTTLQALGRLYLKGVNVDWKGFHGASGGRIALPTYPFQRSRFWLAPVAPTAPPIQVEAAGDGHPHLSRRTDSALGQVIFDIRLDPTRRPYLLEHRVNGSAILPTAFYLDLIASAAAQILGADGSVLEDLVIHRPVPIAPDGHDLQLLMTPGAPTGQFQMFSRESDGWSLAVSGNFEAPGSASADRPAGPVNAARPRPDFQAVDIDQFYQAMERIGLNFGPDFHRIAELRRRDGEAEGEISPITDPGFGLHPAVLDGCLQTLAAALPGFDPASIQTEVYMPVGIDHFELFGCPDVTLRTRGNIEPDSGVAPETRVGHLTIEDADGRSVARICGVRMKRAAAPRRPALAAPELFFQVDWRRVEPTASIAGTAAFDEAVSDLLVFDDDAGAGRRLLNHLQSSGPPPDVVRAGAEFVEASGTFGIDPANPEHYHRLMAAMGAEGRLPDKIVFLWPIDADMPRDAPPDDLAKRLERCCGSLLHFLQAYSAQAKGAPAKLWIVTRSAQAVLPSDPLEGLVQSALLGFAKVAALELPEIVCHRVDLGRLEDVDSLLGEIALGSGEPVVAIRDGERYFARLRPAGAPSKSLGLGRDLQIMERGTFQGLGLRNVERRPLGERDVEIQVAASGLNFRDVLNVLGARHDETPLGGEVSGVVTRLGPKVEGLSVGQAVVAISYGGHGDFATGSAELTLPKPPNLDWAQAAAGSLAFLTAHYALEVIGAMKPGERVLIHAAAGGVGMAAVQIAQRGGLEVFATAGSPEKRAILQAMAARGVYDSRNLDFAAEILRDTNGEGVDLVLSAVTGPAIAAGMTLLRPGGRYLEIGKAEIMTRAQAAAINPNAAYHALDLSESIVHSPAKVRPLFVDITTKLASGALEPLPMQTFALADAAAAFEHLARARHVGKVVLLMDGDRPSALNSKADLRLALRPDASYLVSGGLTGLGLASAGRLVERGARRIILFGRRPPAADALRAIEHMRAEGAEIVVLKADVSDAAQMQALFAKHLSSGPPLRGVIHSAGKLADGVLTQQSLTRFCEPLGPKAVGGWLLHQLTADMPLDFFVLYSSASALLGSRGQANYAAANAFLDGLAAYRRARGAAAVSIDWGAWADIGVAADEHTLQRLGEHGLAPLTVDEGLAALEHIVQQPTAQVGVLRADWNRIAAYLENVTERRFLDDLVVVHPPTGRNEPTTQPVNIRAAPANKRAGLLISLVKDQVAQVLGVSRSDIIAHNQPFRDMGLDSLMALELRTRLKKALSLQAPLPATMAFDYPTVSALTAYLQSDVLGWISAKQASANPATQRTVIDDIEEKSDEEIDRLLGLRREDVS